MLELTLEERVARLEAAVAKLEEPNADKNAGWLTRFINRPVTDDLRESYALAAEYGRYFRNTGQHPPEDWNPGDPIPEPNEEAM